MDYPLIETNDLVKTYVMEAMEVHALRRVSLTPPDTGTAILPLMCRGEDSTFTFAKRCLADGLYVTPIVFPAVPQNAPRIRCSITAALSEEDITLALEVIEKHREWLA